VSKGHATFVLDLQIKRGVQPEHWVHHAGRHNMLGVPLVQVLEHSAKYLRGDLLCAGVLRVTEWLCQALADLVLEPGVALLWGGVG
jgi:hypothetical protein